MPDNDYSFCILSMALQEHKYCCFWSLTDFLSEMLWQPISRVLEHEKHQMLPPTNATTVLWRWRQITAVNRCIKTVWLAGTLHLDLEVRKYFNRSASQTLGRSYGERNELWSTVKTIKLFKNKECNKYKHDREPKQDCSKRGHRWMETWLVADDPCISWNSLMYCGDFKVDIFNERYLLLGLTVRDMPLLIRDTNWGFECKKKGNKIHLCQHAR